MFTDLTPMYSFEKMNWYETPGFNQLLLVGCILVFLSIIPVGLIGYIRNRRASGDRNAAPRGARVAGWIIAVIGVLNLLFVAGTMLWVNSTQGFGVTLGVPISYRIVLGLGVLSAALTIGALVCMTLAWKNRYWSITGRAYYTLVTVAAVAFVWFMNYWNLLGWRY
jgi:hypothetical protein